jgi:hypothetical protein
MRFRRTGETAYAVALRAACAYERGEDAWAIISAAEARHGHSVAMEAADAFEFIKDDDAHMAASRRALADLLEAMGDA